MCIQLSLSLHIYLLYLLLNSFDGNDVLSLIYVCETVQQQETLDFISPDLCPPSGPDLNPVDYRILGLTKERGYIVQTTPAT